MKRRLVLVLLGLLGGCAAVAPTAASPRPPPSGASMKLGNFSVSLAVRDLGASRTFYEKLGFRAVAGEAARHWLILQNETATIGLFQGGLPRNVLTFNPGWDRSGGTLADFDDVRDLQRALKRTGLTLSSEADESTTGPASLMLMDPDGNPVLLDQHVPAPRR